MEELALDDHGKLQEDSIVEKKSITTIRDQR
jgi:hypothetical protein